MDPKPLDDLASSINIELNPSYVVLGEVQNVIAAMRLNTRWSSRSRGQRAKDVPLLPNLLKLRKKLETEPDVFVTTDVIEILKPFLEVIRSDKTTGPITGVALSSVYKFLQYGFLSLQHRGAIVAIEEICSAVTHCRFEGTDPDMDEVVLTKILNVLRKCVQVDAGALLSDQSVYDMVQTCFKMSIQMHLSALLRKSAELALMEIVQHVFGMYGTDRKSHTETAAEKILLEASSRSASVVSSIEIEAKGSPALSRSSPNVHTTTSADGSVLNPDEESSQPAAVQETTYTNSQGVRFDADEDLVGKPSNASGTGLRPFGLPVLIKLFRFFCSIINPNYVNNTDTMRFLGLALVNCVLEIKSSTVEHTPKLIELVRDDLCKFLLQSLGSTDNVSIMTVSLRVAFNLFISLRHKLKFQLELFFNYIFGLFQHAVDDGEVSKASEEQPEGVEVPPPLNPPTPSAASRGEGTVPYEHLEIALETIVQLCADPNFLVDIYISYDCDLNSNNLFARLADFLYKTAFPHNNQLLSINLLALDGLLAILYSVENRFKRPSQSRTETATSSITADQLKERKNRKNLLQAAANHFNRKPKDGIKFLLEKQLLPSPADPRATAVFFRNNKWINKTMLGEFFGEPDEFNVECLKEFIRLTQYNGRKFVDVVREFLQSFRIPKEAQKIERIMDLFSRDYYEREKSTCRTVDASYLLCFSIVMLNTELYNPNVPPHRRMTIEGYAKNLRGTNGGEDFPPEMLSENYNSIKDNEIKIPEEQVNERLISNSTWRYLLTNYEQQDSSSSSVVDSGIYDKFLFSLTWRQIHAAICSVFSAASDAELCEQMLQALCMSGEICAHFSLHHAFDNLVTTLGELTTLVSAAGSTPYAEKLRYVQFSRNKKAQLATLALFDLAKSFPTQMREGWRTILSILYNVSPLLKLPLLEREDIFKLPKSLLLDEPPREKQEAASSPILGIMTSFWPFGGGSQASEPTNEDNSTDSEDEQDAGPTVASDHETPRERLRRLIVHDCKLSVLLQKTKEVDIGSLDHLLKNLISAATPKWAKQTTKEGRQHKPTSREVAISVFAMDLLVDVVINNSHRVKQIWMHLHELFEKIIILLPSPNAVTNKAVISLLYLGAKVLPELSHSSACEDVLATVSLLTKLSEENTVFYSERISVALGKVIVRCAEHFKSEASWKALFALAQWTLQFPKFTKDTFDGVVFVVSPFRYQQKLSAKQLEQGFVSHPRSLSFVSPQNFSALLDLVIAFSQLPFLPVEVALECLELLQNLVALVPALLGIPVPTASASSALSSSGTTIPTELLVVDLSTESRALEAFVNPLLAALSNRTRDPRVLVRHHAMSHLQKALLAPEMGICTSPSWLQIFDKVIFPLLVELLEPVAYDTPRDVVEETRLRASSLLCKTFLHYMSRIDVSSFHTLWLKVLSFVEMYMKADNSELLSEAVTESLKNILLVMFASGYLAKPANSVDGTPNPQGSTLWDLSWKTIDTFSPNLRREFMLKVYPPVAEAPTPVVTEPATPPVADASDPNLL